MYILRESNSKNILCISKTLKEIKDKFADNTELLETPFYDHDNPHFCYVHGINGIFFPTSKELEFQHFVREVQKLNPRKIKVQKTQIKAEFSICSEHRPYFRITIHCPAPGYYWATGEIWFDKVKDYDLYELFIPFRLDDFHDLPSSLDPKFILESSMVNGTNYAPEHDPGFKRLDYQELIYQINPYIFFKKKNDSWATSFVDHKRELLHPVIKEKLSELIDLREIGL